MNQPLRLRGISGAVKGKVWESDSLLRAGRLGTLEIVLDDSSVSRRHAEVRNCDNGWWVRDLDSTNGTYINGVRLRDAERQLHARDIVQFGRVAMVVELVENGNEPVPQFDVLPNQSVLELREHGDGVQRTFRVEASLFTSWEEVQRGFDERADGPRSAIAISADRLGGEGDSLRSLLNEIRTHIEVDAGAMTLLDHKGMLNNHSPTSRRIFGSFRCFNRPIAERCLSRGESILFNYDRLPLLADALMDAGCDNDEMVLHCRAAGPHVRDCSLVNLLLGRT